MPEDPGSTPSPAARLLRRVVATQQFGLVVVIVALGAAVAAVAGNETFVVGRQAMPDGAVRVIEVTRNRLLNAPVLVNYAKDTSFIAIMAIGMTAVIISAGIDLSVGSTYALAGVCGAMVLHELGPVGSDLPAAATVLGIAATLAAAGLCGLLNGLAVVSLRVHPFIITLGTMKVLRGIAFVSTEAESIGDFPAAFTGVVRGNLGFGGGLQPVPLIVMLGMALLGTVYLSHMVSGRHVYAVGGNLETARFSGLRTRRIVLSVYVLCGTCAGVASVLANGIYGSAMCNRGDGYELNVIAAAVVGGASLTGGRGTALGAVLGAMLIQLIEQSIITLGINQDYNQIIIGAAVVLAVVLDQVSRRTTARRLAAAGGPASSQATVPQGRRS
ncbi:MAG TPA: ABC transporter permease [Phycisphaerae bacterium]|nr:ABC transporter permease [Phycisphaerae bacterium]